jgi:hypothetical protein
MQEGAAGHQHDSTAGTLQQPDQHYQHQQQQQRDLPQNQHHQPPHQQQQQQVQLPPPSALGAYTQREEHLQRQEALGEIEFAYVLNDGAPLNMKRWVWKADRPAFNNY